MMIVAERQAALNKLRTKIKNGEYSKPDLINMRSQFRKTDSQLNRERIQIIDEALATKAPKVSRVDHPTGIVYEKEEYVAVKYLQTLRGARDRKIEFSLTLADVRRLLSRTKCYYSGLPFDPTSNASSMTFDRIDCNKGYVRGNVVACMEKINSLKNELIEQTGAPFKDDPKLLAKVAAKWVKKI